jgi:hypothetical protein
MPDLQSIRLTPRTVTGALHRQRHLAVATLLLLSVACHRSPSGIPAAAAAAPAPAPAAAPSILSASPLTPLPASPNGARLPDAIADSTWWGMVRTFSEPGGYFRSENFVSNELGLQHVVTRLRASAPPGGVYMGVGPEQNFTYIAALQPRIAFIVDIRRQNLLQHLWYKAVFELSPDRASFLSRLFARPLPRNAAPSAGWGADSLIARLERTPADSLYFRRTFDEVRRHLVSTRGIPLDTADLATLRYVDSIFYSSGPELNYSSGSGGGGGFRGGFRRMPTFASIAQATNENGRNVGFLGSEASYHVVRDMERRNLIVPVVGNFAGPHALQSVGRWLRDRGATVNVFYTSNVEQYLFQQGDEWSRFYANVGSMPLDTAARFIRSVTGGFGAPTGFMMTQLTSEIGPIVRDATAGVLNGYGDVIRRSMP